MITPLLAVRQTALGGGVCHHIVSAAVWKGALPGMTVELTVNSRSDLAQPVAPGTTTPSGHEARLPAEHSSSHKNLSEELPLVGGSSSPTSSDLPSTAWCQLSHRPSPLTGGLTGRALRLQGAGRPSAASSASWLAATGSRCLHTSPAASGAAAVAAVAAAAAAAEAAAATGRQRRSGGGGGAAAAAERPSGPRRQLPLSPHAYEFQRRFFQLVNSGTAAVMASSTGGNDLAAEAVVHTTNSQAIRMLLAWLEEGRVTAAAEYDRERKASAAESAALPAGAPPPPGAVAAPYRLDQQTVDRAMEVLWRLYQREGVVPRGREAAAAAAAAARSGRGATGGGGGGGPMELSELLNAAEVLAAASPAMGLTFKKQHYELLLELYGKRALQDPSSRRGLAQRLLAVRQQMVQQLLPLSQSGLNTLLQGVRTDPLLDNPTKLGWAIRLVERDLPIGTSSSSSSGTASASRTSSSSSSPSSSSRGGGGGDSGALTAPLQQTLGFLLRTAAREADWTAYGKLEAALVCRTRTPPPYEVLLEALSAASAAGGPTSRLALGFLAQIEQLEASEPPRPRPQQQQQQQQQQLRDNNNKLQPRLSQSQSQSQQQQQPQDALQQQDQQQQQQALTPQQQQQQHRREQQRYLQQQQQRRQELEAERRLDQELRSLRQLVAGGVRMGEEALARKSYDRLRRLFWRDHPAVAAAAAAEAAKAAKAKAKAAAAGAGGVAAAAAKGVGEEDGGEGEEEEEDGETVAAAAANPTAAYGHAAVLEAARLCPAPPDATLELLSLSLAGRDWPAVLNHVTELAELQSLVRRSGGRVGRLLMGNADWVVGFTSAYGGLGPVSEALIASEEDTVAYYTELLRRVGAAASSGAAAPFAGSFVPFGPPLRAAAARSDLASVSGIVRQMRELQCGPGADSYVAVVEASLRGGKPERVPGLLELMLEERLVPTAPMWEVQLRAATEAGDPAGLAAVAERALSLAHSNPQCRDGVARISGQVLSDASALASVRADGRVASSLKLLALRGEELRNQGWERLRSDSEREARRDRRGAEAAALRRNAVQLQKHQQQQWTRPQRQQPEQQQ